MGGKLATYKGNAYLVLGHVKVKHPNTGEWFDAYLYDRVSDSLEPVQRFVRECRDFEDKFETTEGFTPSHLEKGTWIEGAKQLIRSIVDGAPHNWLLHACRGGPVLYDFLRKLDAAARKLYKEERHETTALSRLGQGPDKT